MYHFVVELFIEVVLINHVVTTMVSVKNVVVIDDRT